MKPLSRVLVIKLGSLSEFVLSLPAMKRIQLARDMAAPKPCRSPEGSTWSK